MGSRFHANWNLNCKKLVKMFKMEKIGKKCVKNVMKIYGIWPIVLSCDSKPMYIILYIEMLLWSLFFDIVIRYVIVIIISFRKYT